MTLPRLSRRKAIQSMVAAGGAGILSTRGLAAGDRDGGASTSVVTIRVDPTPKYELSPYLFMQFMEPLGVTDGSVEAAWDHQQNRWREDVVARTKELAPTMVRWGGIFTDYYKWREGVGPREQRPSMLNLLWGGRESNQVGTLEFADFCTQVGAEPLVCVNFEGDGRQQFRNANGSLRVGDSREAAEWVAYCNSPDNPQRRDHGQSQPVPIRYWQLGNETSYDKRGFDRNTAIRKTIEFSKAMRAVDPEIKIIA